MDIEIKIGREVRGSDAIRVPSSFDKVSRNHATICWHDGIVTIEDNNSTNGTYVNGNRITKTRIHEDDIVWLGGLGTDETCLKLDLRRIFASFPKPQNTPRFNYPQQYPETNSGSHMPENNQRTDYSKEFARLKQTYINYHAELSEIKKKTTMRMQLPRVFLSLIPAVLGLVFMFVLGFGNMGFIAMMIGSVLSGLIGTLTMGKSTSRQEEMSEKILDLQLKYQKEYKCPKCGKEYSLDLHWKKLQADGKCPFGCGARFN